MTYLLQSDRTCQSLSFRHQSRRSVVDTAMQFMESPGPPESVGKESTNRYPVVWFTPGMRGPGKGTHAG